MPSRLRILLAAFTGAVILNAVILTVLTHLYRKEPERRAYADAVPVRLVRIDPPDRLEEIRPDPPDPPKPKQRPEFAPDLLRPSLARFAAPDIGVTIDPGRFDMPQGTDFVFDMNDVDEEPVPIVETQPVYPPRAQTLGVEGKVVLEFLVMADGSVQEVKILSARPEGYFEESVLKAASTWRFRPGKIRGRSVNSLWRRTIDFTFQ